MAQIFTDFLTEHAVTLTLTPLSHFHTFDTILNRLYIEAVLIMCKRLTCLFISKINT